MSSDVRPAHLCSVLGPFHMGRTAAAICLLSRGSKQVDDRSMSGLVRSCRADMDTDHSPLWAARCKRTTCSFTPDCHPIR